MNEKEVRVQLERWKGYSAYEVAVQNGFDGTQQEWLESLAGGTLQITVNGKSVDTSGDIKVYAGDIKMDGGAMNTVATKLATHDERIEEKVNTADIVNNLTSGGTAKVLSAEQGKTLKAQIDSQAFKATATLSASGWSGSGPYTQEVTVSGVASGDEPTVDVNLASASTEAAIEELEEAWSMVKKGTTASGAITFIALENPEINIPIKVKGR